MRFSVVAAMVAALCLATSVRAADCPNGACQSAAKTAEASPPVLFLTPAFPAVVLSPAFPETFVVATPQVPGVWKYRAVQKRHRAKVVFKYGQ